MPFTASFLQAVTDYRALLEKGYPQKAVHKLVGDRYSLSGIERSVLFRGITTRDQCMSRISKQAEPCDVTGNELIVDGFNVILSIGSYLNGNFVFISNDGLLRDASEIHGKTFRPELYKRSTGLILDYLLTIHPAAVRFILDAQLRSSIEIAALLAEKTTGSAFGVEVIISGSADKTLVDSDGLIATSDSVIIDRFHGKIFDLARFVLDHHFHPNFLKFG